MTTATITSQEQQVSLCKQIRRWILQCTTQAGSGHPTSSLSAVELMSTLFFNGHFRFNVGEPELPNNDRIVFSKGHATPLLYALWTAAGQLSEEELLRYRQFGSPLEGHPTSRFRFAEAATGSLGQGLSIGVGMALNAKYLDELPYRTFVLLGDSEMAEGAQWEAIQIAAHYQLNNLVGILDVNALGQRGETMYGHDLSAYERRIAAFGWNCIVVEDGHDLEQVESAFQDATTDGTAPTMIIAGTSKGRGVSFLEGEHGWHGKPLDEDQLRQALEELGSIEPVTATITPAERIPVVESTVVCSDDCAYEIGDEVATRNAYGNALKRLSSKYPKLVALDGEVGNSTRAEFFKEQTTSRFFEMFVAEQNMAGTALGLSLRGKLPFVSSFAAFLTRAFDQIRMSPHSEANINFVGSHAGVSIGEDGPSQMGLEDIAMFRTIAESVVLYPCDAVSTEKLVDEMASHEGIGYLRTTRGKTPVIYHHTEQFPIGGSKVLKMSDDDQLTIVTAGITVHEALRACELLQQANIKVRLIDLYSIKPLDIETLREAASATKFIMTFEDHYPQGGLGEAVAAGLSMVDVPVLIHAVEKRPMSGDSQLLLADQGLTAKAMVEAAQRNLSRFDRGAEVTPST